jgi:ectoine hydroxylase-related dioxygenase (phytanoyl-CoA dioxygenase family)
MPLQTLVADSSTKDILRSMERDGAAIIAEVIPRAMIECLTAEVMPYIERTKMGKDEFAGQHTQRTGALVARSPRCRELVMKRVILDAAQGFLAPFTERIILHLTQTININPNQGLQPLHRDRLAWGVHLPQSVEPQFNTMWALTDFTASNGATRLVPGSHKWDWERRADPDQFCQAEMAAGSVLLYSGSVLHSGGENKSDRSRLGLNITYCLGWLRQEENQYLSCPPHIAKDLDPELQELLGYTQGNYALGYYSDPNLADAHNDVLPPEKVLGRKPREGLRFLLPATTDDEAASESR